MKRTIAIDFDGVISSYTGWKGKGVFGDPIAGCKSSLEKLKADGWMIVVFTTRLEIDAISEFLKYHQIPYDYINFNPDNIEQMLFPGKVLADVYLDDRAVRFDGVWGSELLNKICESSPWWKK